MIHTKAKLSTEITILSDVEPHIALFNGFLARTIRQLTSEQARGLFLRHVSRQVDTLYAAEEEQPGTALWRVILESVGAKKIEVLKIVREVAGLGLREAKDIVDAVGAGPVPIASDLSIQKAREMKRRLESVGAVARLD